MDFHLVASDLENIMEDAMGKTVIFTSYVDTVESIYNDVKGMGYNPVACYGKTSDEIPNNVKMFQNNKDVNPLVASIQTLSTGVTLTAANTMIFSNRPWRSVDFSQARDRIYRIGQKLPCFIFTLILDTGTEENLSTRMEEVMSWSKEMFERMVGDRV